MNAIFSVCQMQLANPALTPEERAFCEERVGKLLMVFQWIKVVLDYYYLVDGEIVAAATQEEIAAITWDFSPFEALDPNITLQEVRL
jgi:hypothetical protein